MWTRRSVFDEMSSFFKDFDTLFNRVVEGNRLLPTAGARRRELPATSGGEQDAQAWMTTTFPAVECFTRRDRMVYRAEMPGVDPKDVELTVQGNRLTIRGEKKSEQKVEEADYFFQEVDYGRFERSFELPEGTTADEVKASFKNGVLEVTAPAKALTAGTKVPIEITPEPDKKTTKAA